MRAVIQRVIEASVTVDGSTVGSIQEGLLVLLGISRSDNTKDADYLLDKILGLRIFPDDKGKMNRNVVESHGSLLVVSQFTLYGDCSRGRRPSFDAAAPPEQAKELYEYFVSSARKGPVPIETGIFQASMKVKLVNEGPVTILIESQSR